MDNLPAFKLWLQTKNYSPSTIRNYLVDLNKYFESSLPLADYLQSIASDPNNKRYLSSLNKYFEFSVDQNLITQNPLKAALKQLRSSSEPASPTPDELLKQYQQHLIKQNTAPVTIKNYLNDLRQYISWLETQKLEPQTSI